MALSRTKSHGLGHIALDLDDSAAKAAPSGSVGNDGRVKVQFHESATTLNAWCERFQSAFGDRKPPTRPRPRRFSSVAIPLSEQRNPNPRLNIAIHIVGSRGDVQPFIPIAQILSREPYNHRVRICTHPIFKDFVEAQGVEFFSIGGDPEALMAYMVKNPGLLPSRESMRAGDVGKRRKEMWEIINGCWRSCIEAGNGMGERQTAARVQYAKDLFIADAIIANPPSMAHIHCAEKLGIPLHMVFTMPWSPTDKFSHPLASMSYGNADAGVANYLSYMMIELLTWQGLGDLINKLRTQVLHLDSISPMWGYQLLPRLRVPFTYLWSESLIPNPSDWGSHINITGFSFLPLASQYTPPDDLVKFLEAGDPPIYIGFGSIVVDDPQALTELIFEAVKKAGVRAIVSQGWGGVGGGDKVPDSIYLIGNCPHDWLFQRVSAVVHHGGAGTTAAGISAGRPTVVVPFFGDQPFWGQMMARAGAGPKPVPFKEMTADTLAESIKFALKPEVKKAAAKMATRIAEEDGAGDAAADFNNHINFDDLRCDFCPDRLAVWRHKKTGSHLSGFALSCLVDEDIVHPRDVKLIRHKHWYVDEGAEHPVIGGVAAVSGFFTSVGVATTDFSQRIKSRPKKQKPIPAQPEESRAEPAASNDVDDRTLAESGIQEQDQEKDQVKDQIKDQVEHDEIQEKDDEEVQEQAREKDEEKIKEKDQETIREKDQEKTHEKDDTSGFRDSDGVLKGGNASGSPSLTPAEMETIAYKMATKSLRAADTTSPRVQRVKTLREKRKESWKIQEQGENGHIYYITRATGRYAADVTKAGFKAPVAFFYNVSNGFHNFPSYAMAATQVRRRDEITGFGTGVQTAGKEFVLGFYDAFSGLALEPYKGARDDGVQGLGVGIWRGFRGLFFNLGASVFGLSGYTLKGIEKEMQKRHLTKLKAEILLIRVRQGIDDFRNGTPAQREKVVRRWKATFPAKPA